MVSMDVNDHVYLFTPTHTAQELCESRGGRSDLPVPNSPYGLCERKATLNTNTLFALIFLLTSDLVIVLLIFILMYGDQLANSQHWKQMLSNTSLFSSKAKRGCRLENDIYLKGN